MPAKLKDCLLGAGSAAAAGLRFIARVLSCCRQLRRERDEVARLSEQAKRDIGLTDYDVAVIVRRPVLRRCWRWVLSCPAEQCRYRALCFAECRRTLDPCH